MIAQLRIQVLILIVTTHYIGDFQKLMKLEEENCMMNARINAESAIEAKLHFLSQKQVH